MSLDAKGKDGCCCAHAFRLGVTQWGCKVHGHHRVTTEPTTTLLLRNEDAYKLVDRIRVHMAAYP